ncbi:hypothetical protein [Streptomyces sp. NPDC020965]|uniref:hypothetical protein n=1 Tax=Streptomyces sp. NPDC020965 TaxID=3365105 RepID=UPI0037AF4B09
MTTHHVGDQKVPGASCLRRYRPPGPKEAPGLLCDVRETANLVTTAHLHFTTPAGAR